MTCPHCGGENPSTGRFCIFCGASLIVDIGPEEQEPPEEEVQQAAAEGEVGGTIDERVVSLQSAVEGIREDLSRLLNRLSETERQIRELSPTGRSPQPPRHTAVPPGPATATAPSGFVPPRARAFQPTTAGAPPRPPGAKIFDTMAGWNWEWLAGGNWLARIGVVALIIGIGFFLRLAFDNDWIGETGRVALAIVGGLALLGAGEYWQRKYPIWAQPLTGGGIALLFLSIFAAFSLYDLINNVTAFGLFFLITLAAAGLALKNESMSIAILGIIGGFITPILLAIEVSDESGLKFVTDKLPDPRLLIAYVLVLDLGVLALATFRNWRWFTLLALAGSLGLYWFWHDQLDPSLLLSQLGITFIFLIFMGATTLFHILWRRASGLADQALMVLNAAAYFGISYGLLFDEFQAWMGGFTLLLSVVYGLLAYAVLARSREQVYLSFFAVGIAAVFLTIAVPVQLGGPWISVAWAVEGAVLLYMSFTLRLPQLRLFGLAVFGAFAGYLLFIDTPDALGSDFTPIFNVFMVAYALVIGITYLMAYLLYRERENLQPWEAYLFPAFLVAGNLFLTITVPIQAVGAWIAVTWAIEAAVLMWLSFRLGLIELRLFSLGVFAILIVRLLAFDTRDVDDETFRPIINYRFLAFAAGIASMYAAAYMLWRWRERLVHEREGVLMMVFMGAASFVTLWILSAEVIASVDSEFFDAKRSIAGDLKILGLSILWATYAAIGIVLGIMRRSRSMRLAGLALLAIPVLKLFVFDVFELEQGYRVGAFMGLGALLVVGGFLYQKYSRAIRGFILE